MKCRICSRCRVRRRASRLAGLGLFLSTALAAQTTVKLPFVGCPSDGQAGPVKAPTQPRKTVMIRAAPARRMASYEADMASSVIGPRGWQCLGVYGSGGSLLLVTPGPINTQQYFSSSRKNFEGPIIELGYESFEGSGSPGVAEVLARLFPRYKAIARATLKSFYLPVPSGPYPADRRTYRSERVVEYETPPLTDGLGTSGGGVQKNSDPISGVVILVGERPDVIQLTVRLPRDLRDLTPAIITQVERDAALTTPQ